MSKKLVLIYEGASSSSMVIDLKYVTDIVILEDAPDLIDNTKGVNYGLQKENEKKLVEKEFSQRSWCKKGQLGR